MVGRWAGLTARGITLIAWITGRSNRVETPPGVAQIGILGLMRLPQSKGVTMNLPPPIGALIKVTRGSSVYLGTVDSSFLFTIGGKTGFHIHVHNENDQPVSSSLFVSDEQWSLISL